MKKTGTDLWLPPNTGATNESGFTGLPAGSRLEEGGWNGLGWYGEFWTSTENTWLFKWNRVLSKNNTDVLNFYTVKYYGKSVRCLNNFTIPNQPPTQPSNPSPQNGSTNISIDTVLSWSCSDPDGDDLTYNIYFGTETNPPLIQVNHADTFYNPCTLLNDAIYYWKIVAYDTPGDSTVGDVWSFSTTQELVGDIGDEYGGGIIAYILQFGDPGYVEGETHGIIAAASDQSNSVIWGCYGTTIGITSTALGAGAANTAAIVASCVTAGIAARLCNELELNGHIDWYLPSKDELNKLYQNKDIIGGFSVGNYWSSSEYSSYYAWSQFFYTGVQYDNDKNYHRNVRAVRAF